MQSVVDSDESSYLILCPMGFEIVMQESVMCALTEEGFGKVSTIEMIFRYHGLDDVESLRIRVKDQLRKKRRKRIKSNVEIDDEKVHPIVGPLNDGSDIFIGEYNSKVVAAKAGATEISLLLLRTPAPPFVVCNIRSIGAILALITYKNNVFHESTNSNDASKSIKSLISEDSYISGYRSALRLWALHARLWRENFCSSSSNNFPTTDILEMKIRGKQGLSYRASCLRNQKKKRNLKSCELLAAIASTVPTSHFQGLHLIGKDDEAMKSNNTVAWKVDLKYYDFEVVGFVIDNNFALGISLLPYNFLNSTDFSRGSLPSDITPPIIGSGNNNLIRLRPTTASLLLHIARPQPGDVLVDTCAGIGTIPVEAGLANKSIVGIGGDVVSELEPLISHYTFKSRMFNKMGKGSSEMLLWDATISPLRNGCVDIIVSDLPFGQKCMDTNKLRQFCPLLIAEMARILRPGGRAILLAGALQNTLDALYTVGNNVFKPCKSIFPVNVGGLLAYVVEVERLNASPVLKENHREKIRKLSVRRLEVERRNINNNGNADNNTKQSKRVRLQAG